MLRRLSIENYALIDNLSLELGPGLNIITGETGAGKSILLGALGLMLGNRADTSVLMDSSRNCLVEGEFDIAPYGLDAFFDDNDIEYYDKTTIRRMVSPSGKSRAYINDFPVPLPLLKEFGTRLIDIHSQHQSRLLGQESFRTGLLDNIVGDKTISSQYTKAYLSLRAAQKDLATLTEKAEADARDRQWLAYQLEELEGAGLSEETYEHLESTFRELTHAEEIQTALAQSFDLFDNEETGVLVNLKQISHNLRHIENKYPGAATLLGMVDSAMVELREATREIESEAGRIDSDPARLADITVKLDNIYSLQQKHRAQSVGELIEITRGYRERLDAIESFSAKIEQLTAECGRLEKEAVRLAGATTTERGKAAGKLSKHVVDTLSSLGMPDTSFTAEITPSGTLKPSGADEISFLFSANKGAKPAPVEKVASGGETSRIMLALKAMAARSGKLPTIIFDEIDTGVSGRIADAMGNIISALSTNMQVVNITHLPQVASKGDNHFFVYKQKEDGKTQTHIRRLTQAEREHEIANMLSGSTTTQAALEQARILLCQDVENGLEKG